MPFTLAHPAAVLPLRRFRLLQTVPLIIGSITPDLPYYVPTRIAGRIITETHTLVGSIIICVPLGLALLVFGSVLRRPLTALMTVRARWLCLRAMERFASRPLHWMLAVPSIVLGAWTHIAWDSFTHANGWMVQRVAALSAPVSFFDLYTGEVCHVLQYLSSAFGLAVLASWYRRLPARTPKPASDGPLRSWTPLLLLLVLVAALVIGGLQALKYAHAQTFYHISYLMLTRTIAWFAVLYLATGMLVMVSRRAEAQPVS
jgi:hypothetical protein